MQIEYMWVCIDASSWPSDCDFPLPRRRPSNGKESSRRYIQTVCCLLSIYALLLLVLSRASHLLSLSLSGSLNRVPTDRGSDCRCSVYLVFNVYLFKSNCPYGMYQAIKRICLSSSYPLEDDSLLAVRYFQFGEEEEEEEERGPECSTGCLCVTTAPRGFSKVERRWHLAWVQESFL